MRSFEASVSDGQFAHVYSESHVSYQRNDWMCSQTGVCICSWSVSKYKSVSPQMFVL